MIKSQHSLAKLDAMAKIFYKEIDSEFNLTIKLTAWPNDELKPVMNFMLQNLKKLITGRPEVLESLATQLMPIINQAKVDYRANHPAILKNGIALVTIKEINRYVNDLVKKSFRTIFTYDLPSNNCFTQKYNGALAYRHAKRLATNTCPYCNTQFTFTIKNKRAKTRPQFDHFLDKGTHPYFALSFYNLIPSCQTCNSAGIKGQKQFSIKTHLHPFIDNIEGLYQFKTKVDAADFLVKGEDFKLILLPCIGISQAEKKRGKRNINAFALDDRYKFHKDYAEEIIKKAYFYNNTAIEDLFTSFKIGTKSIFKSEAEVKELVMGNYLEADSFHKRILSKLTKDIAEEFGLTL